MIRLSAVAKPVPDDEQEHWKNVIFEEQPYLVNVYPGDTRSIGIIFVIRDAQIEYFNLGVRPIDRAYFTMGDAEPEQNTASTVATASRTVLRKRLSVLKIKS